MNHTLRCLLDTRNSITRAFEAAMEEYSGHDQDRVLAGLTFTASRLDNVIDDARRLAARNDGNDPN